MSTGWYASCSACRKHVAVSSNQSHSSEKGRGARPAAPAARSSASVAPPVATGTSPVPAAPAASAQLTLPAVPAAAATPALPAAPAGAAAPDEAPVPPGTPAAAPVLPERPPSPTPAAAADTHTSASQVSPSLQLRSSRHGHPSVPSGQAGSLLDAPPQPAPASQVPRAANTAAVHTRLVFTMPLRQPADNALTCCATKPRAGQAMGPRGASQILRAPQNR
jgi:hypothetical protein